MNRDVVSEVDMCGFIKGAKLYKDSKSESKNVIEFCPSTLVIPDSSLVNVYSSESNNEQLTNFSWFHWNYNIDN